MSIIEALKDCAFGPLASAVNRLYPMGARVYPSMALILAGGVVPGHSRDGAIAATRG
jgi:hypothetical protein